MIGFSLTTMRYFLPYDIAPLPEYRALSRSGSRSARPTGGRWKRAIPGWRCC